MNKILVIEDDEGFRATLVATLEEQGFEVLQASTGAQGVQIARAEEPNLILCDVELQGVGGNLVLYAVRRDPKLASIPFVLMSGFTVLETVPQAREQGADAFLAKPFTPVRLATTIDECLGRRRNSDDQVRNNSSESTAPTKSGSLGGLLRPLKQILEATGLITTSYSRLELKEIVGLATQAHQAASSVYQEIETWLPAAETGR
jgi:DNA-binding response OmpR family regulator